MPAGRPRGKPAEPVLGNKVSVKGHVFVMLTKENTPRLTFNIAFDTRGKDVVLDMQATCDILGNLPFNFTNLQGTAARVGAFLMVNDSDKNPNKKNMQGQIDAAKTTRDQLKALGELATELNQKASIPFCVYAALGEDNDAASPEVVLFQSGQFEKTKAGGTKKNAKGNNKGHATSDIWWNGTMAGAEKLQRGVVLNLPESEAMGDLPHGTPKLACCPDSSPAAIHRHRPTTGRAGRQDRCTDGPNNSSRRNSASNGMRLMFWERLVPKRRRPCRRCIPFWMSNRARTNTPGAWPPGHWGASVPPPRRKYPS